MIDPINIGLNELGSAQKAIDETRNGLDHPALRKYNETRIEWRKIVRGVFAAELENRNFAWRPMQARSPKLRRPRPPRLRRSVGPDRLMGVVANTPIGDLVGKGSRPPPRESKLP